MNSFASTRLVEFVSQRKAEGHARLVYRTFRTNWCKKPYEWYWNHTMNLVFEIVQMDFGLDGERIQLLHYGPAHTSGDIVVFFPEKRLAFVGDLVFVGRDPLIHRQKGGTSTGLVKTLQALLDLGADKYVPGHGEVLGRSEVEAALESLREKQDRVRALIREGKSLEETKAAFGISTAPAKPGGFSFPSLVEVIYLELSAK